MTEGEVVEVLVTQTSILLAAVGVFFSVVSVYLAGLNYFLAEETAVTRFIALFFVTIALVMVVVIMYGAQVQHTGLVARLVELNASDALTAAGKAALGNNTAGLHYMRGRVLTVDEAVVYVTWASAALTYLSLVFLTFFYKWRGRANLRDMP
ncbi:MAG: hypothetical protein IV086_05320 [Hyphomonadaceae bacterium]|nr:MAG: hypothetical protein FD160_85 [Caulobacteraceae bacterium]MBT9445098.1 hypothetical protein [Hyphomonadaceae bacterium]TPW08421.1 MAG: hypothetical protein FD124_385 [Alphaproteobacteria bacterium]